MKVTVLVDNTDGIRVKGEWGLSFFIEYDDKTILLDAGLSDLFAENAEKLGADISSVDIAMLSHAHDDHANGFEKFFELNDRAKLYIAADCYEDCYDRHGLFYKYAGIPRGILKRHNDRIVRADGKMQIADGVWLLAHSTPGLERVGADARMFLRQGLFKFVPDDFRHEQSLIFELDDGLGVFNSCSHAGADVIIKEAQEAFPGKPVKAMAGGFHLFRKDDEYVKEFAKRLSSTGVEKIYTGHCTGARAQAILREELGDRMHDLSAGLEFEL